MKTLFLSLMVLLMSGSVFGQGTPVKNLFGSGVPNANLASVVGTTYVDQSTVPATVYTCTAVTQTPNLSQCSWTAAGSGGGAVSSVFTRTGAVVAANNDYTLSQIALTPLTNGQLLYDNSGAAAGFGSYNNSTLLLTLPGGVATTPGGGYGGFVSSPEGTVGNGTLGANAANATDVCYASSVSHAFLCSFNNSAFLPLVTAPVPHSSIAATAVTPGSYTNANITVAADGSVTAAANGSGGGGGVALVPATTAANTIAPTVNSVIGLTVLGTTGTATDYFDVCIASAGACSLKVLSVNSNIDTSLAGNLTVGTSHGNFTLSSSTTHITNASGANTDVSGTIALSSATSGTHTFATAYGSAPICVISPISDPTATGVWWVTTATTGVTANVKTSGTITFNYQCMGAPN